MRKKKSWTEKLNDDKDLPRVFAIEGKMTRRWGVGTCVIPAPREVDAVMRSVRRGRLITINGVRERLAKKHRATIGCPITSGIFAWIAAHAAAEQERAGKKRVTPWWRTLKAGGELNPKYPGGVAEQQKRLEAEGHRVTNRGKRTVVADFETAIV